MLRLDGAFVVLSVTYLCITCWAEDPPGAIGEWPSWRGTDGRGRYRQVPIVAEAFTENVRVCWQRPLGPGYSGIAVAECRVYTMDRNPELRTERILCWEGSNGEMLWKFEYPADYGDLDYGKGPRATPLLHKGRIFAIGAVGHVHCLDAASGRLLWSKHAIRDWNGRLPTWGFAASPIAYGSQVIFHVGADPGTYVAVDATDGRIAWRAGSDPCGYATPLLVQHQQRDLLLGWTPEHVMGIDPAAGKVLWKIPYQVTYGVSIASPIFEQKIVLVSGYWEGTKAVRIGDAPDEARLLWEDTRQLRGLMAQPLYDQGLVYLLDRTHGLCCFELKTGRVLWSGEHRLTPPGRNPHASIVWAGPGQILALNSNGELVFAEVTPSGYREFGRRRITSETWAHPAFCGEWVFARDDQNLVCVKLPIRKNATLR